MNDIMDIVFVEGDILKTFSQLIVLVVGLDLVTLILMLFARGARDIS